MKLKKSFSAFLACVILFAAVSCDNKKTSTESYDSNFQEETSAEPISEETKPSFDYGSLPKTVFGGE